MDPHSRDPQSSETFTRFLRQLEFFKHVDYSALRTILAASRQFTVKKGSTVFVEDEVARTGFVLVEGRLRLYSTGNTFFEPRRRARLPRRQRADRRDGQVRDGDRGDRSFAD